MQKLSKKTKQKIKQILSVSIYKKKYPEFANIWSEDLFEGTPEEWSKLEHALCDYQNSIQIIFEKLFDELF